MNKPEENQDRKQERRKKFSKPKNKNKEYVDDDKDIKHTQKKEIKKIKESFQDEEWEDWDRYYNH